MLDSGVDLLIPRIKPLYYISEQEIIQYAYHANIEHEFVECEYSEDAPNLHIKSILQDMENDRKGLMLSLMRQYQKVLLPLIEPHQKTKEKKREMKCILCGMPTTQKKCAFCRNQRVLLDRIRQLEKITNPAVEIIGSEPSIPISPESKIHQTSENEVEYDDEDIDATQSNLDNDIDSDLDSQDDSDETESDDDLEDDDPSNSGD